jgi:hypothetical protein
MLVGALLMLSFLIPISTVHAQDGNAKRNLGWLVKHLVKHLRRTIRRRLKSFGLRK